MGRRIAIVSLLAAVGVAGCGIDQGKLETASDAAGRTTTTTTVPIGTTVPHHTTEPSQRTSADDLLLDATDLGTDWTAGGTGIDVPLPACAETTTGAGPVDEAQQTLVGSAMGAALLQRAAVYGSEEQAHQAVAQFRSGLEACENGIVHVDDLSVPRVGDEVEAFRLKLGGTTVGVPFELACVRVDARVSCLTFIAARPSGRDQFPSIVRAAADKLG
ncbi:MAG: hypothetical protein JO291_07540 [Acidimicrobiia bacterium]|nr:hypothetical protein [Acidimicrobiia bacterium]